MTAELISVIIPAHNVERFIGQTLSSVLDQSYRNIEVIVVDDGSTDETSRVVKTFIERDNRVSLIQTQNRGVSAARNLAISRSRAKFIAPIDGDDVWHRDKLARQLKLMLSCRDEVGMVYCWSAGIDEHSRVILPTWNNSVATGDVLRDIVVKGIAGNGSTPLIRKKFIELVGGYDTALTLCEDWKFYTELAGVCEFAVVPEYLTGYRLRDDSASSNVRELEQAIEQVTQWIWTKWPWLSKDVFWDRTYVVNAYLAVLAIRQREFGDGLRLLARAGQARPRRIVTVSYIELWFLLVAHALGLRVYRWQFWKRPPYVFADSDHPS